MKDGRESAREEERKEHVAKTGRQAERKTGTKTKHGPGWGTVARGVGEGVQSSVRAGGSAEGEGKLKMGAAGGRYPDHGSPGNHVRDVDLPSFSRE